ncbi:Kinesin-like protein NACK1 [Acorus calamus]|uniref:Kinesin-like protein n=1 Tax=Acorus calamus TaxID=4465 RepID=A0AAV9FJU9_ACOCL|nr:Kinesin-like protein NACK1 [Acorus calamus]
MFPTAYSFDRVFGCECTTRQVYEEGAKEVALSVVSGINSSIFAYGQTSSGKTFTMTGITEYTVADIYDYIEKHKERAFVLKFSAIEIYNEAVRDLLSTDSTPLRLLDDPERGTVVDKLTEEVLRDWDHLRELLAVCEAQRQIGETSLNETSSRSHQILRLMIESSACEFLGKDNSSTLAASVNFVDLAGSERASQALSAGTRLKEGCHINRSLLTLGTVIRKLSKGRYGHIPYRDSKLTRILQPSLGGNAKTAIICTMSPARSHIEQSRNTLLFASCAKEVVTSAQVNVVMSDKALVKHLQRELARLENELRAPGPPSSMSYSETLLKEKDARIQKMEREIRELIQQRDLAKSRLEDLLRVVEVDQPSREYCQAPISHSPDACEDELSISASSGIADQSIDFGFTNFNDKDEHYLYLLEDSNELSGDFSPRHSVSSPAYNGLFSEKNGDETTQDTGEDFEDLCREVQCIEMEHSTLNRSETSNTPLTDENASLLPTNMISKCHDDQDSVFSLKGYRNLGDSVMDFSFETLDQKVQIEEKTIDNHAKPCWEEPSPLPLVGDLSCSRRKKLTRSRSCRAALMTGPSPMFQDAEQNENTPPTDFENDLLGRPESFVRKPLPLNYDCEIETASAADSQSSGHIDSVDLLNAQIMKSASKEDITSLSSFVAGLKEMAQIQLINKFSDGQTLKEMDSAEAHEDFEVVKDVKDVGLDPMQNPMESPSHWTLEFKRQQREIIELWQACNVSLVHRTYFFILFKGDPSDSIYMEVELRRLSFLKRAFSLKSINNLAIKDDSNITPDSRALRREREMLCKRMQRRYSPGEREDLYRKWGIDIGSKQRRLQLARRLWTETNDMDHVRESAAIIAKLIGFSESGQALKEMFGLSFAPQVSNRNSSGGSRRSYSWKHGMSTLV